jgi:hypothetical protein
MSIARRVTLLCAAALATMAMAASTASAQETAIEVRDGLGNHCNPCYFHIEGESVLRVMGMAISICEDEFEAEVYGNQTNGKQGHIYDYENDQATFVGCNFLNCNGVGEAAAESEWRIGPIGEINPDEGHMTVRTCLDNEINPNGAGFHCNMELHVEKGTGANHYLFASTFTCPNGVEIDGRWETEDSPLIHDDVQLVHT